MPAVNGTSSGEVSLSAQTETHAVGVDGGEDDAGAASRIPISHRVSRDTPLGSVNEANPPALANGGGKHLVVGDRLPQGASSEQSGSPLRPSLSQLSPATQRSNNAVTELLRVMAAASSETQAAHGKSNSSGGSSLKLLQVEELRRLLEKPELSSLVDAYHQLESAREAAPAGLEPFVGQESLRRIRNDTLRLAASEEDRLNIDATEDPTDLDQVEVRVLLEELQETLNRPHLVAVMEAYDEVEQQKQEAEAPKVRTLDSHVPSACEQF